VSFFNNKTAEGYPGRPNVCGFLPGSEGRTTLALAEVVDAARLYLHVVLQLLS